MTVEKYCDINYRDYILKVEERKYITGNSLFSGRCTEGIKFFAGWFYDVVIVISKFEKAIDDYIADNSRDKANTNKEGDLLFTVYYKDHKLEIEDKDTLSGESKYYYFGYSENPSFWTWKKTDYISIIEAFRKKVDDKLAGIVEEPADYGLGYKGHVLTIRKDKERDWYSGTCDTLLNKGNKWSLGSCGKESIIDKFKSDVDKLMEKNMKELTYQDVVKEWGNSYKKVNYKNRQITIEVQLRAKDDKAFYIGRFYEKDYNRKWYDSSIESIHYDKVVSRFQRFVDEYCTDWKNYDIQQYNVSNKLYTLSIKKDSQGNNYFGTCEIHKNSTFKCISSDIKEIEDRFKERIDRVVKEKEKVQRKIVTPKQEKIQELEQLQARISAQLEELKKEKDVYTYKGVVLEMDTTPDREGKVKGTLKESKYNFWVEDNLEDLKSRFESYVDKVEDSYNLYRKLTGRKE